MLFLVIPIFLGEAEEKVSTVRSIQRCTGLARGSFCGFRLARFSGVFRVRTSCDAVAQVIWQSKKEELMFLSSKASKLRIREAQNARRNRQEIVKGLADGQITRRDLFKWGLFTTGGLLLWKHGLNPFVRSAYAAVPTGFPRSPLFGVQPFTQPMPRFDVLPRNPIATLNPAPTAQANTTQQVLNPALEGVRPGDTGPIEGRPPGPIWVHQQLTPLPPPIPLS